jgi:hypothetical protein
MIANTAELVVATKSLQTFTKALELLRLDLKDTNPTLFPIVSQTYIRRIRDLQNEILSYYAAHEVNYSQPEPDLAETIREEAQSYTGHLVAEDKATDARTHLERSSRDFADHAPAWASTPEAVKGVELGIRVGRLNMLAVLIRKRLGTISLDLLQRINFATSEQLDAIAERLLDITSTAELKEYLDQN